MNNLFLMLVFSFSLCYTIQYAWIAKNVREPIVNFEFGRELLSCSFCTGFWTGAIVFFITRLFDIGNGLVETYLPQKYVWSYVPIHLTIIFPFLSAVFCHFLNRIDDFMDTVTNAINKQIEEVKPD
jgi:hypothetical protein